METNLIFDIAQAPLKQRLNRVWRTYQGGALIDNWKMASVMVDNNMPEEWIMSTISSRSKDRPIDEGLSRIDLPSGGIYLDELIREAPEVFLGKRIAEKFGTTGVLIKMLDAKERLTIQVHPTKKFAHEMFNSAFGKTESWYILEGREINGEVCCIYLGFKEFVTEGFWRDLFYRQDIVGMLNCLHRFEVQRGDAFIIYGGVPHAIGAGCFLLEVQEPTDYTMRVERKTPSGITINDELIHQGLGETNMLKCFHYEPCSFAEAKRKWKVDPIEVQKSASFILKSIFNETHTNCFALKELLLDGEFCMEGNGDFFIAVIYSGEGKIVCGGKEYTFVQGDELFFAASIQRVVFKSLTTSKILLCYPPI